MVPYDNMITLQATLEVRQGVSEEEEMKVKKYLRGEAADLGVLHDKKLKGQLAMREELHGKSAQATAKAEKWFMPSEECFLEVEGIEKTRRIKQMNLAPEVDILSLRKQFDIVLPDLGPYTLDFSLSGRYMVAAGRKGHIAVVDMIKMNLIKEIQWLITERAQNQWTRYNTMLDDAKAITTPTALVEGGLII